MGAPCHTLLACLTNTHTHTHSLTHSVSALCLLTGLIAGRTGIQKNAQIASYGSCPSQFTSSPPQQEESVQITKSCFIKRPETITPASCAWLVNTAAGAQTNNCRIVTSSNPVPRAIVVASKNISPREPLLTAYSRQYYGTSAKTDILDEVPFFGPKGKPKKKTVTQIERRVQAKYNKLANNSSKLSTREQTLQQVLTRSTIKKVKYNKQI